MLTQAAGKSYSMQQVFVSFSFNFESDLILVPLLIHKLLCEEWQFTALRLQGKGLA